MRGPIRATVLCVVCLVGPGCGRIGYGVADGDGGGRPDGGEDRVVVGEVDCSCGAGGACPGAWPLVLGATGGVRPGSLAVDGAGRVSVAGTFDGVFDHDGTRVVASGIDSFVVSAIRSGVVRWARATDDFGFDQLEQLATDSAGNVYVAGVMDQGLDLGGGPLTATGSPPLDVVVASYGPDGAYRWAARYGGSGAEAASGIAVGEDGSVYIGGLFTGTTDLGGPSSLTARSGEDAFLARYDDGGTTAARWSLSMPGLGPSDAVNEVAVDGAGNVYAVGTFDGATDFGGGDVSPTGAADGFVASYDPSGALRWVTTVGGATDDAAFGVAMAGDLVVASGFFAGAAGLGGESIESVGGNDWFVAGLDAATGDVRWARSIGSPNGDQSWAVAVGTDGHVYASGWMAGPVELEGRLLDVSGVRDALVVSLTREGHLRWGRTLGGDGDDVGLGIAADATGVYASGVFNGTALLGCGSPSTPTLDDRLGFVVRLGP